MEPHSWPFFLLAGMKHELNLTRIAEAVVIAILTASGTVYGTTRVLEAKMSAFERTQEMMRQKLEAVSERQQAAIAERVAKQAEFERRIAILEATKNGSRAR